MRTSLILLYFLLFGSIYISGQDVVNVSSSGAASSDRNTAKGLLGQVAIKNLAALNSNDMDYCPLIYKDGLVFTSTRKHKGQNKKLFKSYKKKFSYLFFSKRDTRGQYHKPEPLEGAINGRYHEGAATFNKEGDVMFFTRNNNNGKNKFGKIDLKIYTAKNIKGNWNDTNEIKAINGDGYSTCHPSISSDGKRLYFASNRNGGYGGMDIYVSYFLDGEWQYPINLGPEINSDGNEIFPFIDDTNQLYFSSDGHEGNGGQDIFKSVWLDTKDDESWSKAANLGLPFNSIKDDFGFSIYNNNQEGFFTSTRAGGQGHDDIYTWRKAFVAQVQLLD